MRSPRIFAGPWRSLHTRSRPPPREPPRVRPSWRAPIPWRKGVGIPSRGPPLASEELTPLERTLEEEAHISWSESSQIPRRGPRLAGEAEATYQHDGALETRARRKPTSAARPEYAAPEDPRRAPEPYNREMAMRKLEYHGPTFVHGRFEELAARHCHPSGSAGTLGAALREMLALGLRPRPDFHGAVLAALTIHPDYLLRSTILDLMRKDWIEMTPEHKVHTVLGLLRDGQYEMALDEVDDMLADGVPVPAYVHEILIFALANLGFLDEAMTHLSHRAQLDPPPCDDLLYFLLDTCAAAQHYSSTTHLWRTAGDKITPSDGTLLKVLDTAARHADPPLALEALRRLSDRRVQMSFHHFEPVVEAYVGAGELEGAFRMLCVMDGAGIRPRRDATRGLFFALRERPGEISSCVGILEGLKETYRVPVAAVNVLLEAAVEVDDVSTAEDIFGRMESLTRDAPTFTTFLPFLTLPIPPLPICAKAISLFPHNLDLPPADLARLAGYLAPHDADAALGYLRRMDAGYRGEVDPWQVYADAVRTVAVELVREEDERAWEFLKEVARRSPSVAEELREMGKAGEL